MKLSMYKNILQEAKIIHAEKIRQIEWYIKIIENHEQAVEDYKQNLENLDLTITEKTQLKKELDHAEEYQTSVEENNLDSTEAERKMGLNNPEVYKPFLTHLKDLRRPPAAAKPVSHSEYHLNSEDDDDSTENDSDDSDSNEL